MSISVKRDQWPAVNLLAALFLVLSLFLLSGCLESKKRLHTHSGMTMGTTFTVKWVDSESDKNAELKVLINGTLNDVNKSMSTYIDDSELSLFNQLPAGSSHKISNELEYVITLGLEISSKSNGAFDITVGPLVNLWGFGPDGRVINAPSEEQLNAVMSRVGYESITVSNGTLHKEKESYIDLSAIAKGYGVDAIAELLESRGIANYLVEIGGELRAKGVKPNNQGWRIAVESPVSSFDRQIHKVIEVKDFGIATSGDYRNYFEENGVRFSHTIDPHTAKPITHKLASVTVLAETCAAADGYATALMVMGPEKAMEFAQEENFEAFLLIKTEQGYKELMTSGFSQYLVQ